MTGIAERVADAAARLVDIKVHYAFEDLTAAEVKELTALLKALNDFQDKRKWVAS